MLIPFPAAVALTALLMAAAPLVNGGACDSAAPASRWSADEARLITSMRLSELPAPPRDPSNAVADLPAAAALGRQLFNDTRLSRNGEVACATCHVADKQFQDGVPLGRGVATGKRRTMPIVGIAHGPWLFWDGRKDSVWSQALGPLEDAAEHGGNRARYVHMLGKYYKPEYEAVFGPLPDLSAVPAEAGPLGSAAERASWQRLDARLRDDVSRVFANMGKAIAAYERTLRYGESRFDRYAQGLVDGNATAQSSLSAQEVRGLQVFINQGQCATCHSGPLFTDQHFHNTGVPPRDPKTPDHGRAAAIAKVQQDEFNCVGPFSDAKPEQCEELRFIAADDPTMSGAFKTPSLRNVALRPPYMHAGQFGTLEEVIAHYNRSPQAVVGHSELAHDRAGHADRRPVRLSPREVDDLAAFLRALSGPIVEVPLR